jgi:hypothetical protein
MSFNVIYSIISTLTVDYDYSIIQIVVLVINPNDSYARNKLLE